MTIVIVNGRRIQLLDNKLTVDVATRRRRPMVDDDLGGLKSTITAFDKVTIGKCNELKQCLPSKSNEKWLYEPCPTY